MAMLPKPGGDSRCVAKTPMVYIMLAIMRRPGVQAWEAQVVQDWDACRPGSSALDAAYLRGLQVEIATRNGEHSGVILWDFRKFFDNVRLQLVYDSARALGFPLIDLVLGLQMHLAPRRLNYNGAVSAQIVTYQSIIAGCALAISFTKALLLEPLSQLVAANTSVDQTVYVDDFSQAAVGNLYDVVSNLAIAG